MKKKPKPAGGGESAPLWIITYADMITLLMGFFVIMLAFSEPKKEDQLKKAMEAIRNELGLSFVPRQSGMGFLGFPTGQFGAPSLRPSHAQDEAEDSGIPGSDPAVTRIREGTLYAVGGRITFEPGSADLDQRSRAALRQLAKRIRGHNNKIELRGHASPMELQNSTRYSDLWLLSYARAKAVMDELTSPEVGLKADRFRLVQAADLEPVARKVYSAEDQTPNRRVEVIVSDVLVEDFTRTETN